MAHDDDAPPDEPRLPSPGRPPLQRHQPSRGFSRGTRRAAASAAGRFDLTPGKFEMVDGRLFWSERDRLVLLALLLENVGADQAVQLGEAEVWREAVMERC